MGNLYNNCLEKIKILIISYAFDNIKIYKNLINVKTLNKLCNNMLCIESTSKDSGICSTLLNK